MNYFKKLFSKNKLFYQVQQCNGQAIIEYLIITTFIGIFCLMAMKQLGEVIERRVQEVKSSLVEKIKVK